MNINWINWVTNIAGFLLVILEPISSYLKNQPFQWDTFLICLLGAVSAYFIGKSKVWENKEV